MSARHRLIVGLDVPTVADAEGVVSTLGDSISFYKIGYQLAFAGGLEFARDLAKQGKQVFLDMKLLDIDNTVASAVENIARMGMTMLTLHAYPKAMAAAVKAAEGSGLCLLGVTVLTSMDEQDLTDAGYEYDPHTLVLKRAEQARIAGMGGVLTTAVTLTGLAFWNLRVSGTWAPSFRAILGAMTMMWSAPGLSAMALPAGRARPSVSLRIRITPPSIDMVWISPRSAAVVSTATKRSSTLAVRVT